MNRQARTRCRWSVAALLLVAGVACSQPELPEVWNGVRAADQCEGGPESHYFPADIFHALPKSQPGDRWSWTRGPSLILDAMHEPPLSCGAQPDSYRFLWIHSFSNWPPTMVRVSQNGEAWEVTAVQLAGSVNRR